MYNILKSEMEKGALIISCTETQSDKPKSFKLDLNQAIQLPKGV